jgi:ribulose-phosphate 3-epimerase
MPSPPLFDELRAAAPQISVGVMTADLMNLGAQLQLLKDTSVKLLHFDVMDGCFCPQMTMGPPFIKAVKTELLKDVHLMIQDPLTKLEQYIAAGADLLTINAESCIHLHRALQIVGEMKNVNTPSRGVVRGVSLNPATPVEVIEPVLDELEMVVLLAVNPGWGGQKFIEAIKRKVTALQRLLREADRDVLICLDGGVNKNNIADIGSLGADVIVTGSAVFDGKDPAGNAKFMTESIKR